MITDAQLLFSEAQDVSQVAGDYTSTNTIDTAPLQSGNEGRNLGALGHGSGLALVIVVPTALAGGAGATLNAKLFSGATASAMTNLHWQSGALLAVDGTSFWGVVKTIIIPLPYDSGVPYLRWLTMQYTIATATTTAGTITASLAAGADAQRLFVNSYVV